MLTVAFSNFLYSHKRQCQEFCWVELKQIKKLSIFGVVYQKKNKEKYGDVRIFSVLEGTMIPVFVN